MEALFCFCALLLIVRTLLHFSTVLLPEHHFLPCLAAQQECGMLQRPLSSSLFPDLSLQQISMFRIRSDCCNLHTFKGTKICLGEYHSFISPCTENLSFLRDGSNSQLRKATSSSVGYFLYLEKIVQVCHCHHMWPLFEQQQQRTANDKHDEADGERRRTSNTGGCF